MSKITFDGSWSQFSKTFWAALSALAAVSWCTYYLRYSKEVTQATDTKRYQSNEWREDTFMQLFCFVSLSCFLSTFHPKDKTTWIQNLRYLFSDVYHAYHSKNSLFQRHFWGCSPGLPGFFPTSNWLSKQLMRLDHHLVGLPPVRRLGVHGAGRSAGDVEGDPLQVATVFR